MEFACCRTELWIYQYLLEYFVDCNNQRFAHILYLRVEFLEVVRKYHFINSGHCFSSRISDSDCCEESLCAVGDTSTAHLGVERAHEEEAL